MNAAPIALAEHLIAGLQNDPRRIDFHNELATRE